MALYSTTMSDNGYHVGMSMIEVLASTTFIQGFDSLGTTARAEIIQFIEGIDSERDRNLLINDIERLLAFETQRDMIHYMHICGASYWPPNEPIDEVFREALNKLAPAACSDQSGL